MWKLLAKRCVAAALALAMTAAPALAGGPGCCKNRKPADEAAACCGCCQKKSGGEERSCCAAKRKASQAKAATATCEATSAGMAIKSSTNKHCSCQAQPAAVAVLETKVELRRALLFCDAAPALLSGTYGRVTVADAWPDPGEASAGPSLLTLHCRWVV